MSTRINASATLLTTNFNLSTFRKRMGCLFSLSLFILLLLVQSAPVIAQNSPLVQLKPDTNNWGGLVGSVTVSPRNANLIFIGTGRGGIYKSINGGRNWDYLENSPAQGISLISFSPSNPDRIIATSVYDTKTSRNGGIWLSTDEGITWNPPPGSTPPITTRCPERVSAGAISWVPRSNTVWVASDCGLMRSDDLGDNWTGPIIVNPAATARSDGEDIRDRPDRLFTVLASDSQHVIAGGDSGYYYLHDESGWHQSVGAQPNFYTVRGLAAAPGDARLLFRADYGSGYLQYSDNQGITWQNFPGPDLVASNAGPFVRTTTSNLGPNYFELYLGTGTDLKRATLRYDVSTWNSATWQTASLDHPDPQEISFHPRTGRPLVLVGDFGVMKSPDGGATWHSLGAGRAGLNALEIRSVATQDFPTSSRPDVSFITWHNHAWTSRDGGNTWTIRALGEGSAIHNSGPAIRDSEDAFVSLQPYDGTTELYGRGMVGLASPYAPPRPGCFKHIAFYNNPVDRRPYILNASYNCEGAVAIYDQRDVRTTRWDEVARIADLPDVEFIYGNPQISVKGAVTTLYNFYSERGTGRRLLLKVNNVNRPGRRIPSISRPAMTDFGTVSVMIFSNRAPVFAVKPDDDQVLIAADGAALEMKRSTDGGSSWMPINLLTRLVKDNDTLRFGTAIDGANSQATVIKFDPYNTNRVLIGTMESGLLFSMNGGTSWDRIPESETVPGILDIAFARNGTVYVATAGRGLWKWEQNSVFSRLDLLYAWLCPGDCREGDLIRLIDPSWKSFVPFDLLRKRETSRIVARKGFITSFLFDQKSQQFVLSATNPESIVLINPGHSRLPLRVLASVESDNFQNCPACTQDAKNGLNIKMLIIEPGRVLGYVAAGKDKGDIPPNKIVFGAETLPDYKLSLSLEGVIKAPGYDIASQGATVMVKGSGFAPGVGDTQTPQYVTIYLNGQRMRERLEADSKGAFEVKIPLNTIPGSGVIEAVQQTSSGRISVERRILINNRDGEVKMK